MLTATAGGYQPPDDPDVYAVIAIVLVVGLVLGIVTLWAA